MVSAPETNERHQVLSPFQRSLCTLSLTYGTAPLDHTALVYIRPRYLQARKRQEQESLRTSRSKMSFGLLQAVSEAVREGDLPNEEDEEDTGNEAENDSENENYDETKRNERNALDRSEQPPSRAITEQDSLSVVTTSVRESRK
jgi:hypothetical protein